LADNTFTHLVVVGSSAGGIGALSGLVSSLPEDFEAPIVESKLSDYQRGQLYLILREAVRNAVTHSGCRHLTVSLDITPENISGLVENDGSGFEGNGETGDGIGLRSIRERAALLKGKAEV
jgi:signal transduction histidine kinase